jgi:hypothetical protein
MAKIHRIGKREATLVPDIIHHGNHAFHKTLTKISREQIERPFDGIPIPLLEATPSHSIALLGTIETLGRRAINEQENRLDKILPPSDLDIFLETLQICQTLFAENQLLDLIPYAAMHLTLGIFEQASLELDNLDINLRENVANYIANPETSGFRRTAISRELREAGVSEETISLVHKAAEVDPKSLSPNYLPPFKRPDFGDRMRMSAAEFKAYQRDRAQYEDMVAKSKDIPTPKKLMDKAEGQLARTTKKNETDAPLEPFRAVAARALKDTGLASAGNRQMLPHNHDLFQIYAENINRLITETTLAASGIVQTLTTLQDTLAENHRTQPMIQQLLAFYEPLLAKAANIENAIDMHTQGVREGNHAAAAIDDSVLKLIMDTVKREGRSVSAFIGPDGELQIDDTMIEQMLNVQDANTPANTPRQSN